MGNDAAGGRSLALRDCAFTRTEDAFNEPADNPAVTRRSAPEAGGRSPARPRAVRVPVPALRGAAQSERALAAVPGPRDRRRPRAEREPAGRARRPDGRSLREQWPD